MSTDKYAEALKFGKQQNPDLFNDSEKLKIKLEELHGLWEIEEDPIAKVIYSQGRNLLAYALGEDLVPEEMPKDNTGVISEPALPEKHVAIIVTSEIYARAMEKSLLLASMQIQVYSEYTSLIQDLLAAKVCGIISIGSKNSYAEGIIRHDIKNLPNWDVVRANEFPLPPIVDICQPVLLSNILEIALQMHEGEFFVQQDEKFLLKNHLAELRNTMLAPEAKLSVVVLDDIAHEVIGILRLLEIWPGEVIVHKFVGEFTMDIEELSQKILDKEPAIILLDEAIDTIKGSDVATALLSGGFKGNLASISGGACPDFTSHHFSMKSLVPGKRQAAELFIGFMNRLISQLK